MRKSTAVICSVAAAGAITLATAGTASATPSGIRHVLNKYTYGGTTQYMANAQFTKGTGSIRAKLECVTTSGHEFWVYGPWVGKGDYSETSWCSLVIGTGGYDVK